MKWDMRARRFNHKNIATALSKTLTKGLRTCSYPNEKHLYNIRLGW